jgi:hypothetical protein
MRITRIYRESVYFALNTVGLTDLQKVNNGKSIFNHSSVVPASLYILACVLCKPPKINFVEKNTFTKRLFRQLFIPIGGKKARIYRADYVLEVARAFLR